MKSLKAIKAENPVIFSAIIFSVCLAIFASAGYITGYVWYHNLLSSLAAEGGYACGATPLIFLVPFVLGIASGLVTGVSSVIVYLLVRAIKKRRLAEAVGP